METSEIHFGLQSATPQLVSDLLESYSIGIEEWSCTIYANQYEFDHPSDMLELLAMILDLGREKYSFTWDIVPRFDWQDPQLFLWIEKDRSVTFSIPLTFEIEDSPNWGAEEFESLKLNHGVEWARISPGGFPPFVETFEQFQERVRSSSFVRLENGRVIIPKDPTGSFKGFLHTHFPFLKRIWRNGA